MLLIEYIITKEADTMGKSTHEAYEKTLAQYHPWVLRKAVGVAVYAVPTKDVLVQKMELTKAEGFFFLLPFFSSVFSAVYLFILIH